MLKATTIWRSVSVFFILVGLVGCSRPVGLINQARDQVAENIKLVDLVPVTNNYQGQVKAIVNQWSVTSVELAQQQRAKLLVLVVPAEYKDLHLALVLISDKIIAGLANRQPAVVQAGLQDLVKIKKQYSWLNF